MAARVRSIRPDAASHKPQLHASVQVSDQGVAYRTGDQRARRGGGGGRVAFSRAERHNRERARSPQAAHRIGE